MRQLLTHRWDLSPNEAEALQLDLAKQVVTHDRLGEVRTVAGVDVAYEKSGGRVVAAVVVLDARSLAVIDTASAEGIARFPYVSGLFSFRELPQIALALERLRTPVDLVVCDGQGIAHPRRFGLACHLGILFDVPSIGCAKTRLLGEGKEPEKRRGSMTPLIDRGDIVGGTLRTQPASKPVFVSVGHRISLPTACEWILRLSPRYRLPETTRMANQAVRIAIKRPS